MYSGSQEICYNKFVFFKSSFNVTNVVIILISCFFDEKEENSKGLYLLERFNFL